MIKKLLPLLYALNALLALGAAIYWIAQADNIGDGLQGALILCVPAFMIAGGVDRIFGENSLKTFTHFFFLHYSLVSIFLLFIAPNL